MASGKVGMDVGKMKVVIKHIQTEIDKLNQLIGRLDKAALGVVWEGKDASTFKTSEWPAAKGKLQQVCHELEQVRNGLKKNMAEQIRVSEK